MGKYQLFDEQTVLTLKDSNGDSLQTDFKYPDEPFYRDAVPARMIDNLRVALNKLDNKEQQIILFRALDPKASLRDLSKAVNLSYEGARKKLHKIRKHYPIFHDRINFMKAKPMPTMARKKKPTNPLMQMEFNF